MANEVIIMVRSKVDVKPGMQAAKREIETYADQSGDAYNQRFNRKLQNLGNIIAAPLQRVGRDIGDKLGTEAGEQFVRDMTKVMDTVDERTSAVTSRTGQKIGENIGNKAGEEAVKIIAVDIGKGGAKITTASEKTGTEIGQEMGSRAGDKLTEKIRTSVMHVPAETSGQSRVAGDRIGETMGEGIREKITRKIREALAHRFTAHVDADVDTNAKSVASTKAKNTDTLETGLSGRAEKIGKDIGDKITTGVGGSLQTFFSGDIISLIVKSFAIGALVTALTPILGGAVITAFGLALGGGVLALGIIAAFRDPRIKGAANDLKKDVTSLFEKFGMPFRSPMADFLEKFDRFLNSSQVKGAAKTLGEIFAPVSAALGTGVISMLQELIPGFVDLAKAAAPMFETLAKHLPQIGDALSKMFSSFADQGDDANLFFNDLLTVIEKVLIFTGQLIASWASAYSVLRRLVVNGAMLFPDLAHAVWGFVKNGKRYFLEFALFALDQLGRLLIGAAAALGWIPGIGPKLHAAAEKFNAFRKTVNNELNKIKDKTVTIKIRQIFTTVGTILQQIAGKLAGKAAGGIVGSVGHAAEGGIRNGLTLVGENGPELADLAPGTRVHSNGDSRRMLSQGAGEQTSKPLVLDRSMDQTLLGVLIKILRMAIAAQGGDVQLVLGKNNGR